ncbi:TPA: hypothetical protein DDZ86_00800 [Candidatus Dependentiae bacterium]|nr:MAG: hypothetical protein UW09_C0004G0042 [candidate division TM6 bacterium GW2011_GWF2_43_87]HBL98163.1 hypothetical protein [Candidatus Dependentiae bacterium]
MTSPLWILNGALTLMYAISVPLMVVMRTEVPVRASLVSRTSPSRPDVDISKINPALIYENDLFDTFVKVEIAAPKEKPHDEIVIPVPPKIEDVPSVKPRETEFLPPLQIKLKGVLLNSNSQFSRAVIANAKTKAEGLYKLGDVIEDATLIHISKVKVTFVRSNGQQEVLFLNEDVAQADPIYEGDRVWASMISQVNESTYRIDTRLFKKKIQSVAQIFELLDFTTAFDKGKSIGGRIGRFAKGSFGSLMGLEHGDIVVAVNGSPTTTPADRVKIYHAIKDAGNNQTIKVSVLRSGSPIELTYITHQMVDDEDDDLEEEEQESLKRLPAGSSVKGTGLAARAPRGQGGSEKSEPSTQMPIPTANKKFRTLASEPAGDLTRMVRKKDKQAMLDFGGRNASLQR